MSTGGTLAHRFARVAAALASAGLVALGPRTRAEATPPLAAAARAFPASERPVFFGPMRDGAVDVLRVRPDGTSSWSRVPFDALGVLPGTARDISVGEIRWPLVDRAASEVHATTVRVRDGLGGRGVVLGLVDTGADVRHPDLRRADGTTRVAWLLDFSRPVRGIHAALEARFAIADMDGTRYGAVYSAADLDALLAREVQSGRRLDEIPVDDVGHGTWCASIAAGNGLATGNGFDAGRYVGMAPEADLVVVRANREARRGFTDAAIAAGSAFVIDRASAMHEPVVLNLSLGSHSGSHDGTSALEGSLAHWVSGDAPGVAIVTAAGPEGTAAIHARIDLRSTGATEVPIDIPAGDPSTPIVLEIAYQGSASVSVRLSDGITTSPWIAPRDAHAYADGPTVVSIANGTDEDPAQTAGIDPHDPAASVRNATIVFGADPDRHAMRAASRYAVRVEGDGPVHLWIARDDDANPSRFAAGNVADGTTSIPATSRRLISVASLITRLDWTIPDGTTVHAMASTGASEHDAIGTLSAFTSRGPNRINESSPDLAAPGEWLVAAMSAQATPDQPASVFRARAAPLVVEDGVHAAQRGTSGATPVVAGVIALMLEAFPRATQDEIRGALVATARRSNGWNPAGGWGEVTADAALDALRRVMRASEVDASLSEATVTAPFVADGEAVSVMVRSRDALGGAVALDAAMPPVVIAPSGIIESVRELGPGVFEARWRADDASARAGLVAFTVQIGSVVLRAQPSVRVVRSVSNGAAGVSAGNGWGVGGRAGNGRWIVLALVAFASRRVRSKRR